MQGAVQEAVQVEFCRDRDRVMVVVTCSWRTVTHTMGSNSTIKRTTQRKLGGTAGV
jgi:hypothetical protein